nr:MAG TPA: hypothetical protein [Caudoviricetes sp.]
MPYVSVSRAPGSSAIYYTTKQPKPQYFFFLSRWCIIWVQRYASEFPKG